MAADAADPAGIGRLPLPDITFLSLFHRKKSPFGGSQRRRGLFLLTARRRGGSAKTARKAHGLCSFPDGAFRGRKSARQKVRTATSRADKKFVHRLPVTAGAQVWSLRIWLSAACAHHSDPLAGLRTPFRFRLPFKTGRTDPPCLLSCLYYSIFFPLCKPFSGFLL